MSSEEPLSEKIRNSRDAVRAHMECGMPERRAEWSEELKRRRFTKKATPQEPAPAAGTAKSLLDASAEAVASEPEKQLKARASEEEGIESYWFGGK